MRNNDRIYNFQKITEPTSFKYPTRILCCASVGKKVKKFCKRIFNGLVKDYGQSQYHDQTKYYCKSQYDGESQYGTESQHAQASKLNHRSQYFGRPRPDDELIDNKSHSNVNWDGTPKNKLNYNNTENGIDLKLIDSKEIRKALIPFRITDEEIEKSKENNIMDMFYAEKIYITPKVASLVFYNFHMKIHNDILILWERGKQIMNKIAVEYNMTYGRYTTCLFEVKRAILSESMRMKYISLSMYQDYAITYKKQLDSTFHLFLREHYLKMRHRFLKLNRALYNATIKTIGITNNEKLMIIQDGEKELFFFT
ncbi:Plasmodium exported protein, unknown function [Plasmodium vinckei vinckei]|uniref:Plasmodium RESA N-terminal domain-containing protein n=1 Tax=Plasmodium vinckei vinckei TaxID=54757 RepID=A0A449BW20_PLAVN|nr:Plasmodium exported protein, unknown function [Plasmodium vinckei vinckei]VEV57680.1 Plasmodium exported protein, unknown function [Plasmodium vinckei vinckei]